MVSIGKYAYTVLVVTKYAPRSNIFHRCKLSYKSLGCCRLMDNSFWWPWPLPGLIFELWPRSWGWPLLSHTFIEKVMKKLILVTSTHSRLHFRAWPRSCGWQLQDGFNFERRTWNPFQVFRTFNPCVISTFSNSVQFSDSGLKVFCLDKGIRAISPHADSMMTVWWLCDDGMVTVCWLYVQIGCTQYVASKMQCSSPRKLYQEKGCKTGTEKQV